jgi:hypothetical protein
MRQTHLTRAGAIRSLSVILLSIAMFSFSERTGVESFSIYLNGTLLLQEYAMPENTVKRISLADADADDILKIHYNHCGAVGVDRTVSLCDSVNKVLKSWSFVNGSSAYMEVRIKDMLPLMKGAKNLNLVYKSREIPNGKVLAGIAIPDRTEARVR